MFLKPSAHSLKCTVSKFMSAFVVLNRGGFIVGGVLLYCLPLNRGGFIVLCMCAF